MKTLISCDWQFIQHPTLGKVRVPSVVAEHGFKKFRAHDGIDGRVVCEIECDSKQASRILRNESCKAVDATAIKPCVVPVPEKDLPCIHRGVVVYLETCTTCAGVRIKVYHCEKLNLCTIEDRDLKGPDGEKLQPCAVCGIRQPP